eukprot:4663348-Amphidinium_carterae.1
MIKVPGSTRKYRFYTKRYWEQCKLNCKGNERHLGYCLLVFVYVFKELSDTKTKMTKRPCKGRLKGLCSVFAAWKNGVGWVQEHHSNKTHAYLLPNQRRRQQQNSETTHMNAGASTSTRISFQISTRTKELTINNDK